ncbi:MAG: glycosyltransferase family 9 protein [Elusimicrobia bacterium]|nr:glycosyltransferase family 9 protein [Elusimicrobiota bacterium]
MVKSAYVPVLEGNPYVDEIIPFRGLWDAIRRARTGGFTHLLDLHSNLRSIVIGRLSGIAHRTRYRKDAIARRLLVAFRMPSPALARHTIDRYMDCLSAWGVPTPARGVQLGDYQAPRESAPAPKNLLVVQTAFLGDATLTLPLAREIKRLLPSCRLTVLARHDTAEMYQSSPWVDETIPDHKSGEHRGLSGLRRLSGALREKRFDAALVPHRSLRSALAVWLAGIPRRIGFSSSAGRFLFTQRIPFSWGMHDLERNLGLLLPLGGSTTSAGTEGDAAIDSVYLKPKGTGPVAESVAKRLAESGPRAGRLVGVHPGSIWPTKRWPKERYAALIRRLTQEAGATAILIGGKGDADLAREILAEAGVPALDWIGKTNLSELVELMGKLSLFITNDSGPMHVATASGVPTLAIFGPTTRELGFFPYGAGHRVLEVDLECRPCGLHGSRACPEGHFLCMKLISVDQAFGAASELLAGVREAAARP